MIGACLQSIQDVLPIAEEEDLSVQTCSIRTALLWVFFNDPKTTAFMKDAFHTESLYRYADPLSCMAVNSMSEGDEFPWHFDTNEFTVSIMLQGARDGGTFEYIPNIRNPGNENYEAVRQVFAGQYEGIKTLELRPGHIQLFKGRYTLHRVTKVVGDQDRYVALPSWSTKPNQVGLVGRMIKSYGRALPIHYEQEYQSPDLLAH